MIIYDIELPTRAMSAKYNRPIHIFCHTRHSTKKPTTLNWYISAKNTSIPIPNTCIQNLLDDSRTNFIMANNLYLTHIFIPRSVPTQYQPITWAEGLHYKRYWGSTVYPNWNEAYCRPPHFELVCNPLTFTKISRLRNFCVKRWATREINRHHGQPLMLLVIYFRTKQRERRASCFLQRNKLW